MAKVIALVRLETGKEVDVELPTDISADTAIRALHQALKIPGDCPSRIRCENPIALLQGEMPLSSFGIRDGSILHM